MNRDEAVKRIQTKLSFRDDKVEEITDALKDAQMQLESEAELPWFLRSEVSSIYTIIGEMRVPLPLDFLGECDDDDTEGLFWYDSTQSTFSEQKWNPLEKVDLALIRAAYQNSNGTPQVYASDDKYFRLGPVPNAAYPLKMIYYRKDLPLDDNIENEWLKYAHELIIGVAGQTISEALRDAAAAGFFQQMEGKGRAKLLARNVANREAGRMRVIGGRD